MNWDAIGAVGEIVGASAVVVSLLYLAVQIRTQNTQARLSALHEISIGFREATAKFANEDISDIFIRANEDFDALSDPELHRLIILTGGLFRAWEEAHIQHKDGHLDVAAWEAMARHYTNIMGAPAVQRVWILRKVNFDPDFQRYVDSIDAPDYKLR